MLQQRQKARRCGLFSVLQRDAGLGALDLAGLHAAGANVGLADMAALIADGDLLDVGLKPTVGHAMRVAYITSSGRLLAANFTNFRHCYQLRIYAYHNGKTVFAKLANKL